MSEFRGGRIMQDKVEMFGHGTVIQHGKHNNRIYLVKLFPSDFPVIIGHINKMARSYGYTKIFCKVPSWAAPMFTADGFMVEAQIPHFYNGQTDLFFMSKYLNSDRIQEIETDQLEMLTAQLKEPWEEYQVNTNNPGYQLIPLDEKHAEAITEVYQQVFDSYPFPIFDPEYIRSTMQEKVQYFGAFKNDRLMALSSAEMDWKGSNAEMTDFATLPEARGNNLSVLLLLEMERVMKKQKISLLYTIARLNSIPMNRTFLKLQYRFAGTLVKNTQIAGKIESMNVYYKSIL